MGQPALQCIICEKELRNVFDEAENQPVKGVTFESEGQYGSTIWDPMDGQHLEINVCDDCIRKRAKEGFVLQGRNRRPVIADGTLVGWEFTKRQLVPWDGERGTDPADCTSIAADEVGKDYLTKTAEGRTIIEWNSYGKDIGKN